MRRSPSQVSTAVIDTSCLLFLDHLDLLPYLNIRYNSIYIPKYVYDEACRKQRKRYRLRRLIKEHRFLKLCSVSSDVDVRFLSDGTLNPETLIDRGEAETIVQARERRISDVLMDDRKGTRVAVRHTLSVRGTLGILKEFRQIRIIGDIKPLVEKLRRDLNYRIDNNTLREILKELGEA